MRSISRTLLGALFALSLSGVAFAETPNVNPSTEPGAFMVIAQLDLEQRFEHSLAGAADGRLLRLSGPTSMTCSHARSVSEFETCVVTAEGTPRSAMPAAMAAN